MKERLEIIQERYDYLNNELLKPEVYEDYKKMQVVSKEKNSIEPIVNAYKKYNTILDDIEAAKEMAHDPEMKDFANEELENLHKEKEEYELFLKLISVKGLGAKLALPILATGSINGIVDAINRENILYLTKFPKIGEKLARQIVLDLKGKIDIEVSEDVLDDTQDLIDTLNALGYKNAEIKKVIGQIDKSISLEEQVKEALKLLLK